MKKTRSFLIPLAAMALCGCNGGGGGGAGTISVDFLSAEEVGIKEANMPRKEDIKQYNGTVDVCLDFEGRHVGWQAVASEYERLQGGNVKINIEWRIAGSEYGTKLNQELVQVQKTGKSDWDIVEGNLGYGNTRKACVDFHTFIDKPNAYCGPTNKEWRDVLSRRAYYNYDSDTKWGDHYILSTEDMQSCWFVNTVALEAAGQKGYLNSNGVVGNPVTWDDLISLCEKMEEAGYDHPLGISLSSSSIKSLQFTWLLRIYGDYYYRQFYKYIQAGDITSTWGRYNKADSCPEKLDGYNPKNCKSLNLLFDESTEFGPGYVGFKSDVYHDFVGQLAKMKGHFINNVADTDFAELRNQFLNQSSGKSSAQIILDYLGQGIQYLQGENENFKLGYFDYPTMVSGEYTKQGILHEPGDKIVEEGTITRDIGGNGGFVSIVNNSDINQVNLSKDFVKFFLSPYGQSIYYKGLYESSDNISPKGLSTVDNDLMYIPEEWEDFMYGATSEEGGISFNGNVDPNPFISYGVRYFNGYDKTETNIVQLWNKLLNSNSKFDVPAFASEWNDYCFSDYKTMCADADHGWPENTYLYPDGNL